jgi:hypothetical protein
MNIYILTIIFFATTNAFGTEKCPSSAVYDFGRLKFPIPSECIYERPLYPEHLDYLDSVGVDLGTSNEGRSQILQTLSFRNSWGSSWYNSDILWKESFERVQKVVAESKLQLNISTSSFAGTLLNHLINLTEIDESPEPRIRLFKILDILSISRVSFDWSLSNNKFQNVLFFVVSKYDSADTSDLFNYFSNKGVNFKQVDIDGRNLLFFIHLKNPELVSLLVEKGLSINLFDKFNKTTLYYAIENCREDAETYDRNLDLIKELIRAGANTFLLNSNGMTAMELASKNRCPETMAFLKDL